MRFSFLAVYFLILISEKSFSQTIDSKDENLIEKKVETIAENTDQEMDYTMLVDNLTRYLQNPLNLNNATYESLDELGLLSDIQINNLLTHIAKNGKLISVYELQSIDGFDLQTIRTIAPYVAVNSDIDNANFSLREVFKYGRNDLFFRYQQNIETEQGYSNDSTLSPNSRFAGSPERLYMRYRFTYSNHVSLGLTAEKDQGEEFFKGTQKQGFDFYSGHFFLRNIGHMKSLAVGDFQAQFGQGLTFWSGLAFGKTADAIAIKRNAIGLKPYTASNENLFLRGVGSTWKFGNFYITGLVSYKKIDGSTATVDSTKDEATTITSFLTSGLHRTPSEIAKRKSVSEFIYGGNVSYVLRTFRVGVTAVHYAFDHNFQTSDNLYNLFQFSGKQNTNIGIDYNYVYRNFNFFGETSLSANGAVATTNGLLISPDNRLTLIALYRNLSKNYQAVYANPISENISSQNERGIYLGFKAQILKNWYLNGYLDVFKFPWLRYQVDAPSKGYEYLAQLTFAPSKTLEIYFRVRRQVKEINNDDPDELTISTLENYGVTHCRFQATYKVSPSIQLRNRVEYVGYRRGNDGLENGWLMYQDITYKALKSPVSLSFRYALFDTDSYNARIYAYENDVLYSFSIPAYYYKGSRAYLTLRYKIVRGIDVWLRYAITFYNNKSTISSGASQINGNTKSEIKAQIRFSF